ncbi:MAG: hypothetical protein NTY14_02350 [Candidatus Omnitrophica bacterium]|nr:hypothetical protein [Candidatus Omnitrophota bacterium]
MKKGQSILEYLIILTAIVAAILLASSGMGTKIQTGRNLAAASIGNSFGLTPSIKPISVPVVDPNDPIVPGYDAQVTIPTSVYLTPSQIRRLVAAGILISGRSNYDPGNKAIEINGTLTDAQRAVVGIIQAEINAASA